MAQPFNHEEVLDTFEYDPASGVLTWKNGKCKGQPALAYIDPKNGYRRGTWKGKSIRQHRMIWFHVTGEWPEEIDHDNRIRHDNRWANLLNSNRSENMKNKSR